MPPTAPAPCDLPRGPLDRGYFCLQEEEVLEALLPEEPELPDEPEPLPDVELLELVDGVFSLLFAAVAPSDFVSEPFLSDPLSVPLSVPLESEPLESEPLSELDSAFAAAPFAEARESLR